MIVQDTVRIGDDPFRIEVEEKRGEYIAKIYFGNDAILSERGESVRGVSTDALESLYGSFSTSTISVRDSEYPITLYEFDRLFYAHIKGSEDGYGFGVDKRRAIDAAINDISEKIGPKTLEDINISMGDIRARNELEDLRKRMKHDESIDWRYIDIPEAEGEIEEAKRYYGIQSDEAIRWIDTAIERLNG